MQRMITTHECTKLYASGNQLQMKAPHCMQQWEPTAYEGTTLYAPVGTKCI